MKIEEVYVFMKEKGIDLNYVVVYVFYIINLCNLDLECCVFVVEFFIKEVICVG